MKTRLTVTLLACLLGASPTAARAQEDDVLEVVTRLFDGMRSADTTLMRTTFHPDVRLFTTGEQDGRPVAQPVPVQRWLDAVASADQVLDERLHDPEVRVDGNLAAVWAFYTLHVGGAFSHCGIDAFQLVRTADGWKITQVADTRRTEDCDTEGDG